MPKKKAGFDRTSHPQLVVRISADLDAVLRQGAELLGVDISGLVRMILTEHAPGYLERGLAARRRLQSARAEPAVGPPPEALAPSERRLDLD